MLGASVVIVVFSVLPFTPSITVGGFHFYLEDVFCVALVGGTGVRVVMRKGVAVPGLVGLWLLVVLAIVRGVSMFGLQPAVNEARQLLYFTAAMVYFSTVPGHPRFIASFRRAWLFVGTLMVGVGVFHWAQSGLGALTSNSVSGRILTGSGAALVLEAAVVALGVSSRPRDVEMALSDHLPRSRGTEPATDHLDRCVRWPSRPCCLGHSHRRAKEYCARTDDPRHGRRRGRPCYSLLAPWVSTRHSEVDLDRASLRRALSVGESRGGNSWCPAS